MPSVVLAASGTCGWKATIRRPIRYSGTCGPGTLVTVRLKKRCTACRRAACWSTVGGVKPVRRVITPAPTACPERLSSRIACSTIR